MINDKNFSRQARQVLSKYLPGEVFKHPSYNLNCQIQQLRRSFETNKDYSDKYIEHILENHILHANIDNEINTNSLDLRDIEGDSVDKENPNIFKEHSLRYSLYPNQFICENCKIVNKIESEDVQNEFKLCRNCESRINLNNSKQVSLVNVCVCGHLTPIKIPICPQCNSDKMQLNQGSNLANCDWICNDCHSKNNVQQFSYCYNCDLPDDAVSTTRVDSSKTMYPKYLHFANTPDIDKFTKNGDFDYDHFKQKVINNYVSEELSNNKPEDYEDNKVDYHVAEDLHNSDNGDYESVIKDKLDETSICYNEFIKWVEDDEDKDDLHKISVNPRDLKNINEYNSVLENNDGHIEKIIPSKYEQEIKDKIGDLGIKDMYVMDGFPFTTVVYGYTRKKRGGKINDEYPVTLQDFNYNNKSKAYVYHKKTDAVLINISNEKIIEWLNMNNLDVSEEYEDYDKNMLFLAKKPSPNEDENLDKSDEYIYKLLHTLSHLFLKSVGSMSGYSTNSLNEIIIPHCGAFIIYKRPSSDFNLGAIKKTFKNNGNKIINQVTKDIENCHRDPICSDVDSHSCEECVYMSTNSCENLNNHLTRKMLIGGDDMVGFKNY